MGTITGLRTMSNKDLIYFATRRRHGSKFLGREGDKEIKQEIERRKRAGKISKSAGKARKTSGYNSGGISSVLSSGRKIRWF